MRNISKEFNPMVKSMLQSFCLVNLCGCVMSDEIPALTILITQYTNSAKISFLLKI